MTNDTQELQELYIHRYFDSRMDEIEKRVDLAGRSHTREHQLEHEAIEKAAEAVDARLEVMNEFRAQLSAERLQYLTREFYEVQHIALRGQMNTTASLMESRLLVLERWQYELQGQRVAQQQGKESGHWVTTATISMVGMIIVIVQFFLHFYTK
jgi:hypothetical protein